MTYYNPPEMHPDDREKFLAWFGAEDLGLEPMDVSAERFSVHRGRVSGQRILRMFDGKALVISDHVVKVPFNLKQRNPLPEFEHARGVN